MKITYLVSSAAAATDEDEDNIETRLINELLGPHVIYDRRARPQFYAVNLSIDFVLETILELVNVGFSSQTTNRQF